MLYRIRRTPWDRLVSLLAPRRRYRCMHPGCAWKGTIGVSSRPAAANATTSTVPASGATAD